MPFASTSSSESLRAWRLQALDWILRGQIGFWLLALLAGTWNAIQSYQEEATTTPNALWVLLRVLAIYLAVCTLMGVITFWRKLDYRLRVYLMLGVFYFVSVLQFGLSSLSGDARGFLFAFVALAAVFLDAPYNLGAQVLALLTFALMGWLTTSGIVDVPAARQLNATDPTAWTSGGIVFALLSVSVSLAVAYLLRSFSRNLAQTKIALQNELRASASFRLLSEVNQLIVRERNSQRLFDEVCRLIVANGYAYAWVGKLSNGSKTPEVLAKAGAPIEATTNELQRSRCTLEALSRRAPVLISVDDETQDICRNCPLVSILPSRAALVVPIQRGDRLFGALVVARSGKDFHEVETDLFSELANDLAYALENIEIETQRRALAETASSLLTARDEASFWPTVLTAVRTILRADRAAIYLYNYSNDSVFCPYSNGLSQGYVDEINRRFRQVPGGRILQDPQPVSVHDAATDPRSAALREALQREGIRSYTVFPLFSAQKILGAFVAYRNELKSFTQPDLENGQTLAHLVAASLQNARLFAETRAKAAEQAALYAAAQDMAARLLDPHALLETLARHLVTALDATSAYILSLDSEGKVFTVLAEYWGEAANPAERKSDLGRMYQTVDYSSLVHSLKLSKAFSMQADDMDVSVMEHREFEEYNLQSKLFIPLLSQGRLVGHAEIWESRGRREFTQNEINLAQTMASYAASVVRITNLYADLEQAYDVTLEGWARALELRDRDTEGHTRRVTELAVRLARVMKIPEEQIVHIRRGAILHDIGKVAISDVILHKSGSLTPAELETIHQHPRYAYEMLRHIEYLHDALDIPYYHHERWDGTGYPHGLKGNEIPLAARIFAVADVYDALTSDRPYRPGWSKEEALEHVREQSGKYFDPKVVKVFLKVIEQISG